MYFMCRPSRARPRRPPPRFTLPSRRVRDIDRVGALPLIVAPGEMLEDPPRVADRLPVDHEHGHHALARELVDLLAVAPAPRDAPFLGLDAAPGELAGDPAAGAQTVRRGLAAVEQHLVHPPEDRLRRHGSGGARHGHDAVPPARGDRSPRLAPRLPLRELERADGPRERPARLRRLLRA